MKSSGADLFNSIIATIILFLIKVLIGCLLWNNAMVRIFDLPVITYWDMILICFLTHSIFPNR